MAETGKIVSLQPPGASQYLAGQEKTIQSHTDFKLLQH